MSNIKFCFGGNTKPANDELYTPESTAEYVLDKYGYLLENKKIILPCDQECSELYKACKRRGFDCTIAQDMYNVDYSKYDICFTNPPFRSLYKYIRFLLDKDVKFLLFAPWSIINRCAAISSEKQIKDGKFHPFYHKVYYIDDFARICTTFIRPDGSEYGVH